MLRLLTFLLLFLPALALAQGGPVQQTGPVTPGHIAVWATNGVVEGGGPAQNGKITNIGIVGGGVPFCINDAPAGSVGGWHQFCLGANAAGGGLLSYNALGGATPLPLQCNVNGVTSNCGAAGGGGNPGGSSTNVQFNNVSAFGGDPTFTFNSTTKVVGASIFNTGNAGYQQGGNQLIVSGTNAAAPVMVAGFNSGAALSLSAAAYETSYGCNTLQNDTNISGENAAFGCLALWKLTTGANNSAFGIHAGGSDLTSASFAVFGNDSARNAVGLTGSVAIGKDAHRNFGSSAGADNNVAAGFQAMFGNSGTITISGTPTTGDVISLTFTAAGSAPYVLPGNPVTVTYTVQSSDTLATITTGLNSAIAGNAHLQAAQPVGIATRFDLIKNTVIALDFAGNSQAGMQITVTSSVSGAATEVITITNGYSGFDNVAIGNQAAMWLQATNPQDNTAIGKRTLLECTTCQQNTVTGAFAGQALISAGGDSFYGYASGVAVTTGFKLALFGANTGQALITASNDALFGADSALVMTGSANSLDGSSSLTLCTTCSFTTAVGAFVLTAVTTNSNNTCGGYAACESLTGYNNAVWGSQSLSAAGGQIGNAVLGDLSATNFAGNNSLVLGAFVANTTMATGNGNILLGTPSSSFLVDTPSAGTSAFLNINNVIMGSSINSASSTTIIDVPSTIYQGNNLALASTTTGAKIDIPRSQMVTGTAISAAGTGAVPGAVVWGSQFFGTYQITNTQVVSATIAAAGTGGTNGTQTVTGTTGTGTPFQASVTVSGGAITAVLSISVAGNYTANPTNIASEPVTGASLSGAALDVVMGALTVVPNTYGRADSISGSCPSTISVTGGGTSGLVLTPSCTVESTLALLPSALGDVLVGAGTTLTTATVVGFVHLPFTTSAPTGTPTNVLGDACEINTATQSLNCYIGSSWYHVAMTSGAN